MHTQLYLILKTKRGTLNLNIYFFNNILAENIPA